MRVVTDRERRARLAKRHGVAPNHRYDTVEDVATAMTALHGTEAATIHLAIHARANDVAIADIEKALYSDRSIVKQLAMRRTLWAFPRDALPDVWGSAAQRTAVPEKKKLVKFATETGFADPVGWVEGAMEDVLTLLSDGEARTTQAIREQIPALNEKFTNGGPDKKWGGTFPIGPRVLTTLGAEGRIVRAENAGHWRLNKPTWTTPEAWLGSIPEPTSPETGYAELVRRWLHTFGPGTEADIVWWLGATKGAVRKALAEVGAVEVGLENSEPGYVLPDDPIQDEPEGDVEPWGALLPTLDPTLMGWKQRDFYLAPHDVPYLFDTNGNGGNTLWWDGRVVGAWAQSEDGVVHPLPIDDIGAEATQALETEAERLTQWLDGVVITNVYKSEQMKQARLP